MKKLKIALAAAVIGAAATAAFAAPAVRNPPPAPVDATVLAAPASKDPQILRGFKLYTEAGCWQCHGYQGSGSGNMPRLVPTLPMAAFTHQLRDPRRVMPIYTAKVMPDQDVAAIYAYLQSQPKPKSGADIPAMLQGQPGN
jgi:mono/diheme cytochrome c family protein